MIDNNRYLEAVITLLHVDYAKCLLQLRDFKSSIAFPGVWAGFGGQIEKGESPKRCAFREIQEEIGYKAKRMTHLITYYPSVGYSTEAIHCFVASGLTRVKMKLDTDEFITVKKMELSRLIKMIKSGKIIDSKTICAVMVYAAKKKLL